MWPNVTFTEEILNGKLHFLYSDSETDILLTVWHFDIFVQSFYLIFDDCSFKTVGRINPIVSKYLYFKKA